MKSPLRRDRYMRPTHVGHPVILPFLDGKLTGPTVLESLRAGDPPEAST